MTRADPHLLRSLVQRFDIGIRWNQTVLGENRTALIDGATGQYTPFRDEDDVASWPDVPRLSGGYRVRNKTAALWVKDTDPLSGRVESVMHKTVYARNAQHNHAEYQAIVEGAMQSRRLLIQGAGTRR